MCRVSVSAQPIVLPSELPSAVSPTPCQKCGDCRVRALMAQHAHTTALKRTSKSNLSQKK